MDLLQLQNQLLLMMTYHSKWNFFFKQKRHTIRRVFFYIFWKILSIYFQRIFINLCLFCDKNCNWQNNNFIHNFEYYLSHNHSNQHFEWHCTNKCQWNKYSTIYRFSYQTWNYRSATKSFIIIWMLGFHFLKNLVIYKISNYISHQAWNKYSPCISQNYRISTSIFKILWSFHIDNGKKSQRHKQITSESQITSNPTPLISVYLTKNIWQNISYWENYYCSCHHYPKW